MVICYYRVSYRPFLGVIITPSAFFSAKLSSFSKFFVKYFKVIVKFFKVFVKFFKDFSPMLLHILYILQSCATQVTSICDKVNIADVIHNT